MTLPSSGPLSLNAINNEFGLGRNLNAYRGVTWYTDAGASGTFTSSNLGFNQFYDKRPDAPYRYGTGSGSWGGVPTPTQGVVFTNINGGQPFDDFEIYGIATTSGQPLGLVLSGSLDGSGSFATSATITSGTPAGAYWFPYSQTNTFQLYQRGPGGNFVALNTWSVTSSL
jgi:hypothetical protein